MAVSSSDLKYQQSTTNNGRLIINSTLRDRTPAPPPEPLADAEVKWGRPSSFSWGSRAGSMNGDPIVRRGGGGVTWPPDPPEDDPKDEKPDVIDQWEEYARVERTVRITGPGDAYVDVARLDEITWRLPDLEEGQRHFVVMKFKKFGDEGAV